MTHTQTQQELEEHLRDQLDFLTSSADAFDLGRESEAKRMAVAIRVLVHDTGKSSSLLGQLGRKSVPFCDSACPLTPNSKTTHSGLAFIEMTFEPEPATRYVAFLDGGTDAPAFVDFDTWWNAPVFVDSTDRRLSRRDLVLSLSNRDGGAHVDRALEPTYADLSRNNSMGWISTLGHGQEEKVEPLGGPERAAVRQICHEVLKTLVPGYAKSPTTPTDAVVFGGFSLTVEEPGSGDSRSSAPEGLARRNERCRCGSGRRLKHCCGALT